MKRLVGLLVLLCLIVPTATACGKTKSSIPPAERLAAAQKLLDATSGLRIDLHTDRLPEGINGLMMAKGIGTKAPAFKGEVRIVTNGLPAGVAVVAVDGQVYINLGSWKPINPADFGAPDPATLFGTSGGLSGLLTQVSNPKAGKDTRRGDQVYSTISGTIPGSAVKALVPQAAETEFAATFLVDDKNKLWQVVIKGPFYPKVEDVTYTIDLADYGTTATITKP